MTGNKEHTYWKSNKEWYFINSEGNYQLTEKAPKEAVLSFMIASQPRADRKKPIPVVRFDD